jgi:hypothetical protein
MKKMARLHLVSSLLLLGLSGCATKQEGGDATATPSKTAGSASDEATIQANLEKLSPEDRKLARDQGLCAVEIKNRLGSMGVPYKVIINGQPVFLCCAGCETKAKAHADRTLARVQQLKEKGAAPK